MVDIKLTRIDRTRILVIACVAAVFLTTLPGSPRAFGVRQTGSMGGRNSSRAVQGTTDLDTLTLERRQEIKTSLIPEFTRARDLLLAEGVPFEPNDLLDPLWVRALTPQLEATPQLQEDRRVTDQVLHRVYIARTLYLPEKTVTDDDVVILARNIVFGGRHASIISPGHGVFIFPIDSETNAGDPSEEPTTYIRTGATPKPADSVGSIATLTPPQIVPVVASHLPDSGRITGAAMSSPSLPAYSKEHRPPMSVYALDALATEGLTVKGANAAKGLTGATASVEWRPRVIGATGTTGATGATEVGLQEQGPPVGVTGMTGATGATGATGTTPSGAGAMGTTGATGQCGGTFSPEGGGGLEGGTGPMGGMGTAGGVGGPGMTPAAIVQTVPASATGLYVYVSTGGAGGMGGRGGTGGNGGQGGTGGTGGRGMTCQECDGGAPNGGEGGTGGKGGTGGTGGQGGPGGPAGNGGTITITNQSCSAVVSAVSNAGANLGGGIGGAGGDGGPGGNPGSGGIPGGGCGGSVGMNGGIGSGGDAGAGGPAGTSAGAPGSPGSVTVTSPPCSGTCSELEFTQCEDELGVLNAECQCLHDTPIILDTDGAGFHLTNVTNGVNFDIANNGVAGRVAWTAPGSTNAFLALDRNGNGTIDNGSELFGNVTPQPSLPHPNGFLALAVYDQPSNGGNGDGKIDASDAIYPKLLLWIDSNHDGISQAGELHSLPELGIAAIYLNYQLSWLRDQYGNLFRYRAAVTPALGAHPGQWTYDVILMQ
jgi:hypothetical protein